MMLAAQGQADFIISLAGMVVPGAETLLWQNRVVLTDASIPQQTVDAYCNALSGAFEAIVHGGSMPQAESLALPESLKQNFQATLQQLQLPYMKRFLSLDMRQQLDRKNCFTGGP